MQVEYKGIDFLRTKLNAKRPRINTRYLYYEMKNLMFDFDVSTPPKLKNWQSSLGWCAKAVDVLNDRLQFREFANDTFNINEIFDMNNKDILISSAIQEALIASCSFVYISKDENGSPRLQVITADNATGIIDPFSYMMTEGYAVLTRDNQKQPIDEAWFIPGATFTYHKGELSGVFYNQSQYCALVPIIFKPDSKRPFGHSRISRSCMSLVGSALRTIKRSEIASEFYSFPQKYISGLAEDAEMDKWKATMSSLITFTKDEDGEHPVVGQFQQQSMQPHTDQLRMFASLFAGETGLTLDDMGFATDNPSSVEAIKAAHENLRLTASKAQKTFGTCLLNVGFVAACFRDDMPYERNQLYRTKPKWEHTFEIDANALSVIGDGIIKINQAVPNAITTENIYDLIGIENG